MKLTKQGSKHSVLLPIQLSIVLSVVNEKKNSLLDLP